MQQRKSRNLRRDAGSLDQCQGRGQMKEFSRRVLLAVSPVFGVAISIAVFNAAHLPFSPPLFAEAWPQWAVFASVVHTSTSAFLFLVNRMFGNPDRTEPGTPSLVT